MCVCWIISCVYIKYYVYQSQQQWTVSVVKTRWTIILLLLLFTDKKLFFRRRKTHAVRDLKKTQTNLIKKLEWLFDFLSFLLRYTFLSTITIVVSEKPFVRTIFVSTLSVWTVRFLSGCKYPRISRNNCSVACLTQI